MHWLPTTLIALALAVTLVPAPAAGDSCPAKTYAFFSTSLVQGPRVRELVCSAEDSTLGGGAVPADSSLIQPGHSRVMVRHFSSDGGVFTAKLTGMGFSGTTIALAPKGAFYDSANVDFNVANSFVANTLTIEVLKNGVVVDKVVYRTAV